MRGWLGLATLLLLAYLCSEHRKAIPWRAVVAGVVVQLGLAILLIRFPPASAVFFLLTDAVEALQRATDAGTVFVFGYLGGGASPFATTHPEASFILAFRVLPLVLVISALSALGFYYHALQKLTLFFAWLLRRTMGLDGPLALGAAVHIFVGMIEAPLLIRPYLLRMQRGEIFALMSCGMAGIAGTVMAIYAAMLEPTVHGALGNILVASVISTPAAMAVSALMVPFRPPAPGAASAAELQEDSLPASAMDAIVRGAMDGVGPAVNIVVMLIVAVALVALVNMALGLVPASWLPAMLGPSLTLQSIFALPFRPVMWLIGIPWDQAGAAAGLMAQKTVLNEFVAYLQLAHEPPAVLDDHSRRILTYALCGFANFGSLGIMLGGLGAMVPERRAEIVGLGLRSLLAGTIATCMSGAVAGVI